MRIRLLVELILRLHAYHFLDAQLALCRGKQLHVTVFEKTAILFSEEVSKYFCVELQLASSS